MGGRRIKSFLDGFKSFGTIITTIINTVLLLSIYFVGIGLAALIVRIAKQELMSLSNIDNSAGYMTNKQNSLMDNSVQKRHLSNRIINKKKHSYYKNELAEKGKLEDYYKQF